MEAYLDNAATTFVYDEVVQAVTEAMTSKYANPSSMHSLGENAKDLIEDARRKIAKTLSANPEEIIFTSGGTEANNIALYGVCGSKWNTGKHIVATCFEHSSVSNVLADLEKKGFEVTYIKPNKYHEIDPTDVLRAVREDTILVTTMAVNNEVGTMIPIGKIGHMLKNLHPNVIYHVDAIQSYGKFYLDVTDIDLLSASGHKFHGPKGTGFLYTKFTTRFNPLFQGGSQEYGLRSGTENVPGIVGLGVAAEKAYEAIYSGSLRRVTANANYLECQLKDMDGVTINEGTSPYIISATFYKIPNDLLQYELSRQGVYVSVGSACSSNGIKTPSKTLKALGFNDMECFNTIRFSLSDTTTKEEIEYAIEVLKKVVPMLQALDNSL